MSEYTWVSVLLYVYVFITSTKLAPDFDTADALTKPLLMISYLLATLYRPTLNNLWPLNLVSRTSDLSQHLATYYNY